MIVANKSEPKSPRLWGKGLRRSFVGLSAFFFLLMLVLPTTFQLQRGVILAVLVACGAVAASARWLVSRDILLLWLLTTCVGTFGVLWGHLNDAPGAAQVSSVYILWPLIYLLFIGLVHCSRTIVTLQKVLVVGVAAASLMALVLLVGAVFDRAEWIREVFAFQGGGIRLYDGYVEMSLFNLATVIYGLPFLTALFFLPNSTGWFKRRGILGLLLVLVLGICALSGRRAFWLLALLTPLLILTIFVLAGVRVRARYLAATSIFIIILAIGGAVTLDLDFSVLSQQFLAAFDSSGEYAASQRYQQFTALMSGWSDNPLIGQGLGATEKSIVRSEEMVWAYELSYVALLFQTGLLGFIVYSSAVLWIFYEGILIVRRRPETAQIVLPLLVGLAGFLLVNATNPYLSKFDYLWTIFLPVAAINAYKTDGGT